MRPRVSPHLPVSDAMSTAALRGKLRPLFDAADTDGSGTMSREELRRLIRSPQAERSGLSISDEQLEQAFRDADADRSNSIDFEEFITVLEKQGSGGTFGGLFGSFFSVLNPLSWFETPVPKPTRRTFPVKKRICRS